MGSFFVSLYWVYDNSFFSVKQPEALILSSKHRDAFEPIFSDPNFGGTPREINKQISNWTVGKANIEKWHYSCKGKNNFNGVKPGSLSRWDRWYMIPQLAVYTTYIPLIVLAYWVIIYHRSHRLREQIETTIEHCTKPPCIYVRFPCNFHSKAMYFWDPSPEWTEMRGKFVLPQDSLREVKLNNCDRTYKISTKTHLIFQIKNPSKKYLPWVKHVITCLLSGWKHTKRACETLTQYKLGVLQSS